MASKGFTDNTTPGRKSNRTGLAFYAKTNLEDEHFL